MITFDEANKIFHLTNGQISYIMEIEDEGILAHIYYGKAVSNYHASRKYPRMDRSFSANLPDAVNRVFSLDTVLQEVSTNGVGDHRIPMSITRLSSGSRVSDYRFDSYSIYKGKRPLQGLPATYVIDDNEATTLDITLVDSLSKLTLTVSYTIYAQRNVITRSARYMNHGEDAIALEKAASMNLDFAQKNLELIHLSGAWAKERHIVREPINYGIKMLESRRGASSHMENPFACLVTPETTETQGDAYGFALLYSGNHETAIQIDHYNQTRIVMGIHSTNFEWILNPDEQFQTPEVALVYSACGLGEMSHTYHQLFKERLVRGTYQDVQRPILVNNWEATYFDFNEEKLLSIADEAVKLGIELFVLDDGWFGHREDDSTSLGDWFVNKSKLPFGLDSLSDKIHAKGLHFGLWFEPEMISKDSNLFRAHPDWALQAPNHGLSPSRDQYILDFSREEVRTNIYNQMKNILDTVAVDYIKWDMNRNMTEIFSTALSPDRQGEVAHRYILGLYDFLEKLTTEYPHILFESCSGGGGRFDAGMLYYMPQIWTSDDTDAIERLKIQYGTSMLYPISTMGSHVSAIPNHQTGRNTSLAIRGNVAMSGLLGYELDLTKISDAEKIEIREQIIFYKKYRPLFQYGTFYRLMNPFCTNDCAWMFVDNRQDTAIAYYFRSLAEPSAPFATIQFQGLDPHKTYIDQNGNKYAGDELMNIGLYIDETLSGDYVTQMFLFTCVSSTK
ncbi:MAG: alpha-galactosidase [Clostridiales Family XIII bacterium]|jgi:alpha-galactosidase|nr:alpha-galactosidase [Clostridiales Family XIII bacterium]